MAVRYFAPAFLYALYNILTYYNLEVFDPTTYFLLLQFRVVVTGVVWQLLFGVKLSVTQWAALVLLTFGCILKQYNFSSDASLDLTLDASLILLGVQVLCSCLAGVYNEYLLKGHSGDVHLMVQVREGGHKGSPACRPLPFHCAIAQVSRSAAGSPACFLARHRTFSCTPTPW